MSQARGTTAQRSLNFWDDALESLREMPVAVRRSFGYSLRALQMRETPVGDITKLKGFRDVYEIRKNFGDAFRLVYYVAIDGSLFVLYVFKKKSHEGSKTPPRDLALIRSRYEEAQLLSQTLMD